MPLIAETSISLRFFGDELVPDALTSALGHPPTRSTTKGEIIKSQATDHVRVARFGSWHYGVDRREPGDLDGQIEELFGVLTADLSVWRSLTEKYKSDLFVGLFMKEYNEGIELSAGCMEILAARGVSLSLDIYGPIRKQDE